MTAPAFSSPGALPSEITERIDALRHEAYAQGFTEGYNRDASAEYCAKTDAARAALDEVIGRYVEDARAAERDADDLQGEVDDLADWQRRVCELLTPEGDRGALSSELAEARIEELLRIERTAPAKIVAAARSTPRPPSR